MNPLVNKASSFHSTLSVLPDYGGRSLANLPATLMSLIGIQPKGFLPPLEDGLLPESLRAGTQRVILLLADGLGDKQLKASLHKGIAPHLGGIVEDARSGKPSRSYSTLTSVFPSSTIPALTSLATGQPPGLHGLVGWMIHIKELGGPTEIASWRPANRIGSFLEPAWGGIDEHDFLEYASIHGLLKDAKIRTHAVGPASFAGAPFTKMLYDGSQYEPYQAPSEIPDVVSSLLTEEIGDERQFIHIYLPTVDSVTHQFGPKSAEHDAAVEQVDRLVGEILEMSSGRNEILTLITADHGHIETNPEHIVDLHEIDWLVESLAVAPTGERRFVYLHPFSGQRDQLRARLEKELSEVLEVFNTEELTERGLFGPTGLSDCAAQRIGDLVLLAKDDYQLVFNHATHSPPPRLRGDHGGTSPDEMIVPFIAFSG